MKALKTNFKQADFIAMQNDPEERANRGVRLEGWIPILSKIFF